jgi:uncharacterized protein YeaO (DUF488 family)/DNA-binding MarR family transcriptional regulator
MVLSDEDYGRLLGLRTGLRHFLRWSEQRAKDAGLTAAQHQLLLAIRGHDDPRGPTVGEVADYLLLRHHSTVELVDRADAADLVARRHDPDDHRIVRLMLTDDGARRLEALSALHLEELERLVMEFPAVWRGLGPVQRVHGFPGSPRGRISVERVYDPVGEERSRPVASRVLVDRLWPRGISREDAPFDIWMKDAAPTTELRKWYGHTPKRFAEFAGRYRREMVDPPTKDAIDELLALAEKGDLVLLTATKDTQGSAAEVLRNVLVRRLKGATGHAR